MSDTPPGFASRLRPVEINQTNDLGVAVELNEDFAKWEWEWDVDYGVVRLISCQAAKLIMGEIAKDAVIDLELAKTDDDIIIELSAFEGRLSFKASFLKAVDYWTGWQDEDARVAAFIRVLETALERLRARPPTGGGDRQC